MFKRLKRLFGKSKPIVNVIRLEGVITSGRGGLSPSLNAKSLEPILRKAFAKGTTAVALAINCPGGSPVQSALIASKIRAFSHDNKIPVIAFCEDVAASGGYWLACAADEIYADENSIIGSIGVISGGFGFPKALSKLGVERRIYTAGISKSTNDPFKPESKDDVAKLKAMLSEIHDSFKTYVRGRRSGKLKAKEPELFNGAFWTGAKALDLGLVDGIGHDRLADHVRGQNLDQLFFVFGLEQSLDGTLWQHVEGRIGRREYHERSLAGQSVDETGCLHGSDQCCVILRVDGIFNNVFGGVHSSAADHRLTGCKC